MSEYIRNSLFDVEPIPLHEEDKRRFSNTIERLLGEEAYGRSQEDGHTATFKLPNTELLPEFLTIRSIFRNDEYRIGWHVTWDRCLGEYSIDPDPIMGKREVWLTEKYGIEKHPSRATYERFIKEIDEEGCVLGDYEAAQFLPELQATTRYEQYQQLRYYFDSLAIVEQKTLDHQFDRAALFSLLRHMEDLHAGHQVIPFDHVIHD